MGMQQTLLMKCSRYFPSPTNRHRPTGHYRGIIAHTHTHAHVNALPRTPQYHTPQIYTQIHVQPSPTILFSPVKRLFSQITKSKVCFPETNDYKSLFAQRLAGRFIYMFVGGVLPPVTSTRTPPLLCDTASCDTTKASEVLQAMASPPSVRSFVPSPS